MKNFKFMFVALVATLGFTACDNDPEHIYDDHSADLVGTWSCLTENYAEVLIINADGTAVSYGVEDGEYWENVSGTVVTKGGNITMTFEDNDNLTGHFDIIPKHSFSLFEDSGERYTYQYCANDLSKEIVGLWVCNDGLTDDVTIMSYSANGKSTITTATALGTDDPLVKQESDYVAVGDLVFMTLPAENVEGQPIYTAARMTYTANGTSAGDIMTHKKYIPSDNGLKESVISFLRVKQSLNFTGTYDYSSAYVSNAEGKDEDFSILGHTFNMADIKGNNFDMFFRSELFCVDLNANSITQHFLPANGQEVEISIPIIVEGNKVTLDYSAITSGLRKVDMYMFQDADDSQLHMYMHTDAFINYFANLEIVTMLQGGELEPTDATAVEKVFADMEARIESINVSFVFKARK